MKAIFALMLVLSGLASIQAHEPLHAIWGECLCEYGGLCECEAGRCYCPNCETHKPKAKAVPNRAVLYFTASWCGPCKTWQKSELPKLEKAGVLIGRGKHHEFRTFTEEDHQEMIEAWKVTAYPTFIFLDETTGDSYTVKRRVVGHVSAADIHRWLN